MKYLVARSKPLLDLIAKHESEGAVRRQGVRSAYDVVWSGIKPQDRPDPDLTKMTVGQVLAWQDRIDPGYRSEAAGRYQIMEDTLRGLLGEAGMTPASRFDAAGQDQLAVALLCRRGLLRFLKGEIGEIAFANNLAKEWASFPVASGKNRGRSYYAGDGLNAASASVEDVLEAIRAVKADAPRPDMAQAEGLAPAGSNDPDLQPQSGIGALVAVIVAAIAAGVSVVASWFVGGG